MRVSFDFDGCLRDSKIVQLICKLFQQAGHDVFILTSRDESCKNIDLINISNELNIPWDRVIMTNGSPKVNFFTKLNFDIHFDNSADEVVQINDRFIGDEKFKKSDSMPAILVNFDSEEMGFLCNFINK
jgi:uncharacterized HAD superfamily protein